MALDDRRPPSAQLGLWLILDQGERNNVWKR